MSECLLVRGEGFIGFERRANVNDARIRQPDIVLVDLYEVCHPNRCRLAQRRIHSLQVQISSAALGKLRIAHGVQRHAKQQVEFFAGRLHKRLHRHITRNIVAESAARHYAQ